MATTIPAPQSAPPPPPDELGPTVRERRSLPGGRAVVGAFLVVLAAVGTFGAYLQATAEPTTRYLVALDTFAAGEVLTTQDISGATTRVDFVALDLPEAQAESLFVEGAVGLDDLVGRVLVAPLDEGDLISRTSVIAPEDAEGVTLSFSVPLERALGGAVKRSETVDVIATFPGVSSAPSETRVVAREVMVLAVAGAGEGLGGGRVTLTVRVADLATAQALQHAVDVANVAIIRGAAADDRAPAPDRSTTSRTAEQDDAGVAADDAQAGA